MRSLIKVIFQIIVVVLFSHNVKAQHYVKLTDASGVSTGSDNAGMIAVTQKLINSLPASLRDSFKVFDGGFYPLHEFIQNGGASNFNQLIQQASSQSKYYLLFGRQIETEQLCTGLKIAINLSGNSSIACIDQKTIEVLTTKLSKKVEAYNGQMYSHAEVSKLEEEVLENFTQELKKYTKCCIGTIKADCYCKNGPESITEQLEEYGYWKWDQVMTNISVAPAGIAFQNTSNLQTAYNLSFDVPLGDSIGTISVNYTNELREFLALNPGSNVRISYFDSLNCFQFENFVPKTLAGEFSEDIVIIAWDGKYQIYTKFKFSETGSTLRSGNSGERQAMIAPIVLWGLRKLIVAGAEVAVDAMLDYGLEKFFSGQSWENALSVWWDKYDMYGALITFGNSLWSPNNKLIYLTKTFGTPVVVNLVRYLANRNWNQPLRFNEVGAQILAGLAEGALAMVFQNLGDKVLKKLKAYDYQTVLNSLKAASNGSEKIVGYFLRNKYFRQMVAQVYFTKFGGTDRGVLWEYTLKFVNSLKGFNHIGPDNGPVDFWAKLSSGGYKQINIKTIDVSLANYTKSFDDHLDKSIKQVIEAFKRKTNKIPSEIKNSPKGFTDFEVQIWINGNKKKIDELNARIYKMFNDYDPSDWPDLEELMLETGIKNKMDLIKFFKVQSVFNS